MKGEELQYKVDGPLARSGNVCYEKSVNATIAVRWRSTKISSMLRVESFKAGGLFGEVLSFTSISAFRSLTVCNGRIFLVNPRLLCQADLFGAIEGICSYLFPALLSFIPFQKKYRITKSRPHIKMLLNLCIRSYL